jgi:SAM-dependent methyltransferase
MSAAHNRRAGTTWPPGGSGSRALPTRFSIRWPKWTPSAGWEATFAARRCSASRPGRRNTGLYAAAGAIVTVVDLSPAQLELDRVVAAERRLELKTVEASMDNLGMFAAGEFDIVIHPVSTCYLPQIEPVYQQVARVTRAGGLYISQHKSPTSLQADILAGSRGYELIEPYYRSGPLPPVVRSPHREEGTLEYLHRWEEILGLMCRAGFVIEDLVEPLHARRPT